MKRALIVGFVVAVASMGMSSGAMAGNGTPINTGSADPLTAAVFGDAPYGAAASDTAAFDATPAFVDAVNHDSKVDLVGHVRDIHSGGQACTVAYDESIAGMWAAFKDPLVFTPGDNEWSDCQKTKELPGSEFGGDPLQHLAAVRSIFFPRPGYTIGGRPKQVLSQAQVGTGTDSNHAENVMWGQSRTVFVTLNIAGGSNNDADNWFGKPRTQAQTDDRPAHAARPQLARPGLRPGGHRRRAQRGHPRAGGHVGPRRQRPRPHRQLQAVHRRHREPHAGFRQARAAAQRRLAHVPLR